MAADGPILLQKDNTFTKLFVGGLPYHTTNETLYDFFAQFGDIEEAVVIHDRVTSKSKGYGFVTMKHKEDAEKACANPNPVIDGRKANVNLAYLGAKNKQQTPTSPLTGYTLGRSESPNGLFTFQTQSPTHNMVPPYFLPSPPPHFFPAADGQPAFSPPPHLINPMFLPQFFNGSPPPFGGYMSPHIPHSTAQKHNNHGQQQQPQQQYVSFNIAN